MGTRPSAHKLVEAARQQLGISEQELWMASVACGGYESPAELAAFLRGTGTLDDQDYDAVAAALNDRFIEADMDPGVPYSDDS